MWKEGGCEFNTMCNMWLLCAWAMFRSARKFSERGKGFVCNICKGGGRKAADEFCFEDVELECVGEFMLNDTSGVEQAVADRVRATWMKFRELGGILCMQGAALRMKGVVYKACVRSVLTYGPETWAMKVGMFQRLRATERRMLRMIC